MTDLTPRVIENREFADYEEEDIQRLNRSEAEKFAENPAFDQTAATVKAEFGNDGQWEEHWITVDDSGSRVYARIYYTSDWGVAVTSDGKIVRKISYPHLDEDGKQLH